MQMCLCACLNRENPSNAAVHVIELFLVFFVPFLLCYRQDRLLCRRIGITDVNWVLDSMVFGVLTEVTYLTTCLQTTGQPIQHRLARVCTRCYVHYYLDLAL